MVLMVMQFNNNTQYAKQVNRTVKKLANEKDEVPVRVENHCPKLAK